MQPPWIQIERAGAQDLPALVPLFDAYRAFFAGNADTARSERFLSERLRAGDSAIFFVRTENGADGFIQLYPLWSSWYCRRIWFLSDLYVRESSRRLGLGRQLVERAIAFAQETDASSVMLELPRSEPHLVRFYAELGFEKDRIFELARKSICSEDRLSRLPETRDMEPIDRREFLVGAGVATAALAAATPVGVGAQSGGAVFLSTWEWGIEANARAAATIGAGGSLLDAVEKGINVVEDDPNVDTVGYGGLPNEQGEVELDAGIMDGAAHRAGSVCNLHKIKNPISVARLVMEKTRHTTIAGEGALQFAIAMGFEPMQLLTPHSLEEWLKWRSTPNHETFWIDRNHHDTIGMVACDGRGHVVAGCSTSGLGVEDSRARRRFAPRRLRILCRRFRGSGIGHRRRRRHGELLHFRVHRFENGCRRASARRLRRRDGFHGEDRTEFARGYVLRDRYQPARRGRRRVDELQTIASIRALAQRQRRAPYGQGVSLLMRSLVLPIALLVFACAVGGAQAANLRFCFGCNFAADATRGIGFFRRRLRRLEFRRRGASRCHISGAKLVAANFEGADLSQSGLRRKRMHRVQLCRRQARWSDVQLVAGGRRELCRLFVQALR